MELDIKKDIKEVLDKGYLMSLATVDEGGVWVCDVIYIYDDNFNIYWMSDPESRHSSAILKNNKVAGTITVSGQQEDGLGIQFEGISEKIEGDRYDLTVKHFKKRNKPEPIEGENILDGDSWYILKPKKLKLLTRSFTALKSKNLSYNFYL